MTMRPALPLRLILALRRWWRDDVLELAKEWRWSFLPPLMVYLAAGISGLTGIAGTFFVKEYLDLSAAFLAALGFWAGIPWALKMPLGHLVDLFWHRKALFVWLGAALVASSLLIMIGLTTDREAMAALWPVSYWYVLSALLAPLGYVLQDVVADAMTVEAVPTRDERGEPLPEAQIKLMHTTLQTLGRIAILGGSVLVSLANVLIFSGTEALSIEEKAPLYARVYTLALVIPLVSVSGVLLASLLRRLERRRHAHLGLDPVLWPEFGTEATAPNWPLLWGSLFFVAFTVTMGLLDFPGNQEVIFVGSLAVILFLMRRLMNELSPHARRTLAGTALVIFVFRATPTAGPGLTWWMIDVLGFDQSFLAKLSLIGSVLTLAGLFIFRRFMAERSILDIVVILSVIGSLLSLPYLGMYHGLHEWTSQMTNGVVDARFIALVNTAVESPLGQVSMVPMLAWIAHSAPQHLKATFFAVMASFTNLALSASELGTKYLNTIFVVTREVRAPDGTILVPADYSQVGMLLTAVIAIGLIAPLATVWYVRSSTRLQAQ
jgi:MFS family permease